MTPGDKAVDPHDPTTSEPPAGPRASGPSPLAGRRILISGFYYWPEATGIAPYATGMAQHFARQGAQVTMLTAIPNYPAWRVYQDYRRHLRLRREEEGVDVRRFRGYVPRRQSAIRRAGYEGSYLLHALSHGRIARPDVILGIVPSLGAGVLARIEARRTGRPYAILFQDLVGRAAEQSGVSGGTKVASITSRIERWAVAKTERVGVISDSFMPYVESLGVPADRITVLRNWSTVSPPTQPRDKVRAELGWLDGQQIVLHTGNMGVKQALEHVVEAARLAASSRREMRFVFMGEGSQQEHLQQAATGLANVDFVAPRFGEHYANALAAADVLLIHEQSTLHDMSLPSKLTNYFASGRPVLAAVSSIGATAREVRQAGAGMVVPSEDPEALLGALRTLAENARLAPELGARGRAYAESELSSERALTRIEAFVASLLDT